MGAQSENSQPNMVSTAITKFVNQTGMHAVPSIVNEKRTTWRSGWTILLVTALIILFVQIYSLCAKLSSHPVSTSVDVAHTNPIEFPAVTFCNMNPMKKSEFSSSSRSKRSASDKSYDDLKRLLFNFKPPEKLAPGMFDESSVISIADPKTIRDNSRIRLSKVMYVMNTQAQEILQRLTYSLSEILVDCRFNGEECDLKNDFVPISSPKFGTCFVFNSGSSTRNQSIPTPVKKSTGIGAYHGLEMILMVDQDDYLTDIAPAAGFRIVIHSPTVPPIPEDEGYIVSPGFYTIFGLRLTRVIRTEEPYGRCKNFTDLENQRMNMYLEKLPLTTPGVEVCMRTCEQTQVIQHCGCYSLSHGYAQAQAFKHLNKTARERPCRTEIDTKEYECVQQVLKNVSQSNMGCRADMCRYQECVKLRYDVSFSSAVWPDKNSINENWNALKYHYGNVISKTASASTFHQNFIKVLISFDDLNVISLTTQPAYEWLDFISDLGGQGGLWLGISIFTVCELLVMFGHLFYIIGKNCLVKKNIKSKEAADMSTLNVRGK